MRIEIGKGENQKDSTLIPTRFKQFVERKGRGRGELNQLSTESKVIAALNKALAIQSRKDGSNYYVAGDVIWCPDIVVTGQQGKQSFKATGRFKIGKAGENLTFGMMQFAIKFRDSKDEMGLPDLSIEEASVKELAKNAPLKG